MSRYLREEAIKKIKLLMKDDIIRLKEKIGDLTEKMYQFEYRKKKLERLLIELD